MLKRIKKFFATLLSPKGCGNCRHWVDENHNKRCDLAESGQCSECENEPFSKWEPKERS